MDLLVAECAEIDAESPVRVPAEKPLFRERGDFHRLVGGDVVHIGDLRVVLQQDVQDRGVDEAVLLLCKKRQGPALFHGDDFFRFDCLRLLLLLDLCLHRDGLFDNGFGGRGGAATRSRFKTVSAPNPRAAASTTPEAA